jgi:hypothetical protein
MHSLLNQETVEQILGGAKHNLITDGSVQPVAFLHCQNGERFVTPLRLAGEYEQRTGYMLTLGKKLKQEGKHLLEALMVMEGWFVEKPDFPLTVRPSQHPARQEAIVLVGRDAKRTRYTSVVQPFRRDGPQGIRFVPVVMAEYAAPLTKGKRPEGLIDFLFPA